MDIIRHSPKRIEIIEDFAINRSKLFEYISKPHKMTLWLANTVKRTSSGFDLVINLPMYKIKNTATIINVDTPHSFEFVWNSEYVMDTSMVTFTLNENNESTELHMNEVGDFDQSRWSDPQSIHIEIWKEAFTNLKSVIQA